MDGWASPAAEESAAKAASHLLDVVCRIGLAFEQGGVAAMASEMTALLVEEIGCHYAEVSLVGAAERRLAVAGVESGVVRMRWQMATATGALYLSVDGPPEVCARAEQIMRAVQPWLRAVSSASPRQAVASRPALLCSRWRLTAKQSRVLEWLGLGLSNKEIAQRQGCSVKTIEAHISQLLRRSGHQGRSDLLQTLWSGDSPGESG